MPSQDHHHLVQLAARWLREDRRCRVLLLEPCKRMGEVMTGQRPDVIAWATAFDSHVVECKVSVSDFVADRKKVHYNEPSLGRFRWFLMPEYLIEPHEVPGGYGLLWEKEGLVRVMQEADPFQMVAQITEKALLLESVYKFQLETRKTTNETRPSQSNKPPATFINRVHGYLAIPGNENDSMLVMMRAMGKDLIPLAGSKSKARTWIKNLMAEQTKVET